MSYKRAQANYTKEQVIGTNGRLACLTCQNDITNKKRTTFCGKTCADAYYIKTRPHYARYLVFLRDHGVCAFCATDTMAGRTGAMVRARGTGHLWQADHIVPVIEGGGECSIDNYRTLCTDCHRIETAALAKRRANARSLLEPSVPEQLMLGEYR